MDQYMTEDVGSSKKFIKLLPLEVSDAPGDLTLVNSIGLEAADHGSLLIGFLSSRVVRIVMPCDKGRASTCERQDGSGWKEYVIHRNLLCAYSRNFHMQFNRSLHQEVLEEAVFFTQKQQNRLKDCMLWEPSHAQDINPYSDLTQDEARVHRRLPAGYVCSAQALLKQYHERRQSVDFIDEWMAANDEGMAADNDPFTAAIVLKEECPYTFNYFVHWLYTQKLDLEDLTIQRQETIYALLYALSERLGVPALRRMCFSKIREYNEYPPTVLPSLETVRVVAKQCSETSMLHKYIVCLFAQAMIDEHTQDCHHKWIDQFPGFAKEVGLEVMRRVQLRAKTILPYEDEAFQVDDSDGDAEDFSDSGSEVDSDCNMDLSDVDSDCIMDLSDAYSEYSMDLSDDETGSLAGSSYSSYESNAFNNVSNNERHKTNLPEHPFVRNGGFSSHASNSGEQSHHYADSVAASSHSTSNEEYMEKMSMSSVDHSTMKVEETPMLRSRPSSTLSEVSPTSSTSSTTLQGTTANDFPGNIPKKRHLPWDDINPNDAASKATSANGKASIATEENGGGTSGVGYKKLKRSEVALGGTKQGTKKHRHMTRNRVKQEIHTFLEEMDRIFPEHKKRQLEQPRLE